MADEEKNPYPPGSARYKLWERRKADREKAKGEESTPPPADEGTPDRTKRREQLDKAIERMQSAQRSDRRNTRNYT